MIYSRADGRPVVLGNRCPHRHAPLSLGRREGDHVRCMYHGLRFDPEGRCVEVPGQTRIQEAMCTRRYPAVQKGAWIWGWMGDPALADEALIPDAYSLRHPEWRYQPGGYMHYEADYLAISDNLLDFSHLSYVHEKTLLVAFEEDKRIITAQQRLIERSAPMGMQPIGADAALGRFRHLVRQAVAAEAKESGRSLAA